MTPQVMSNTDLELLLAGQPPAVQDEIIRINTEARPLALQVALLIPILASILGLFISFRMHAPAGPRVVRLRRRDGPGLSQSRE